MTDNWHTTLPKHPLLKDLSVCIQKNQKSMKAFQAMFLLYYVSFSDLARVTLPAGGYNCPPTVVLASGPVDFIARYYEK